MCAFINHRVFDSGETVENNSSRTALNVVDGGLGKGDAESKGNSKSGDSAKGVGHDQDFSKECLWWVKEKGRYCGMTAKSFF